MSAHSTMTSPYHSKSGLLKIGGSHFSLVWVMELLVKEKIFPENSNLTNLVHIER